LAFAAGGEAFEGEGYVLVAFLFTCKLVETVTEHQYNFFCARLDMYVKSALTAAVYPTVRLILCSVEFNGYVLVAFLVTCKLIKTVTEHEYKSTSTTMQCPYG
jgi:hypothetical protein